MSVFNNICVFAVKASFFLNLVIFLSSELLRGFVNTPFTGRGWIINCTRVATNCNDAV